MVDLIIKVSQWYALCTWFEHLTVTSAYIVIKLLVVDMCLKWHAHVKADALNNCDEKTKVEIGDECIKREIMMMREQPPNWTNSLI